MKKSTFYLIGLLFLFPYFAEASPDFITLTPTSSAKAWQLGKMIPLHKGLESPDHYGIPFDTSSPSNYLILITPYTMSIYLSYSEEPRILLMPQNILDELRRRQDLLYIATASSVTKTAFSISSPVKMIVIIKNGKKFYPDSTLNSVFAELMPSSYCVSYFAFPRKLLLDTPYSIKYVSGEGEPIEVQVTTEKILHMIKKEKNFRP